MRNFSPLCAAILLIPIVAALVAILLTGTDERDAVKQQMDTTATTSVR
jgi:hypothetical protein